MNRRHFLQQSALATLAVGATQMGFALKQQPGPIGLQLYTVRNAMSTDPAGTLRQLADMGYQQVEAFRSDKGDFFGYNPAEWAAQLKDLGLKHISNHVPLSDKKSEAKTLTNNTESLFEDFAKAGLQYAIVPHLSKEDRQTADDWKKVGDQLNAAGKLAQKHGLFVGYHNHAFEFDPVPDGNKKTHGWDLLMQHTDPELVKFELDLYWAVQAKQNPVKLFKAHKGRIHLWHVKDHDPVKNTFAPVGSGDIDFTRIFKAAKTSGMRHYFVEQDKSDNALADVRTSVEFMKRFRY